MTAPAPEDARALWAAEIGALRTEINFTINRMNGNENFAMAGVAALWAGAFGLGDSFPQGAQTLLASLAAGLVAICWWRHEEMRLHLGNVAGYLRDVERRLFVGGGWEAGYASRNDGSPTGGFSRTRAWFWRLAQLVTLLAVATTLKSR